MSCDCSVTYLLHCPKEKQKKRKNKINIKSEKEKKRKRKIVSVSVSHNKAWFTLRIKVCEIDLEMCILVEQLWL